MQSAIGVTISIVARSWSVVAWYCGLRLVVAICTQSWTAESSTYADVWLPIDPSLGGYALLMRRPDDSTIRGPPSGQYTASFGQPACSPRWKDSRAILIG